MLCKVVDLVHDLPTTMISRWWWRLGLQWPREDGSGTLTVLWSDVMIGHGTGFLDRPDGVVLAGAWRDISIPASLEAQVVLAILRNRAHTSLAIGHLKVK